jgi:hypothetical protein
MASQYNDPPAPYTEVVTASGPNEVARINAYTDRNLTKRNVVQPAGTVPGRDEVLKTGSAVGQADPQGDIRRYYANDKAQEIENDGPWIPQDPPAHAPNSWPITTDAMGIPRSRDFYRNGGMVGQEFLDNPEGRR